MLKKQLLLKTYIVTIIHERSLLWMHHLTYLKKWIYPRNGEPWGQHKWRKNRDLSAYFSFSSAILECAKHILYGSLGFEVRVRVPSELFSHTERTVSLLLKWNFCTVIDFQLGINAWRHILKDRGVVLRSLICDCTSHTVYGLWDAVRYISPYIISKSSIFMWMP